MVRPAWPVAPPDQAGCHPDCLKEAHRCEGRGLDIEPVLPIPESQVPGAILPRRRWGVPAIRHDAGALDAYLHAYNPAFSEYIWAVDIRRKGGDLGQDMLGEEPCSTMCFMAMAGKVALVGGGSNCRTWSILRWFPKPGGPPPVRGRAEQTLWCLEDLEPPGYGGHGQ